MKKSLILIITITALIACQNNSSTIQPNNDSQIIEIKKKDPIPHTISQKEVARIALIEAKQFITNAQSKNIELVAATKTYNQAQALYDNGEFKKAQITAVEVRHQVEKLTAPKASSNR